MQTVIGKNNIQLPLYTSLAYAYAKKGELDATWDIINTVERDSLLTTDCVLYTGTTYHFNCFSKYSRK